MKRNKAGRPPSDGVARKVRVQGYVSLATAERMDAARIERAESLGKKAEHFTIGNLLDVDYADDEFDNA